MTAFPESPFGAFERIALEATPLAVIRHEGIRIGDLRDAFDTGYSAIAAQFAAGALVPVGPGARTTASALPGRRSSNARALPACHRGAS